MGVRANGYTNRFTADLLVHLEYDMTTQAVKQMIIDLSELIVTVYIGTALTIGTVGITLLIMLAMGVDF